MNRKLLLTVFSAALLFATSTFAQSIPGVSKVTNLVPKVMFGVKLGANFNGLSGATWDQASKAGVVGGLFLGLHKKKWGLQGEVLLHSAKFEVKGSSGNSSAATLNLDIPVMFEYKIIPRIWAQIGPQFTSILSEKDNNTGTVKNLIKTTDFSGVIGLQAILPLHLVASARYIMGLTNVNNRPGSTETWNNRSIQISLGYRFL
jgi:Outer membrane protein beta-barrel domain